jgi:hypothetical protein
MAADSRNLIPATPKSRNEGTIVNLTRTSQQMTQDLVKAQTVRASLLSQFWRLLAAARAIETQPGAILALSARKLSETEFDVSAVGRVANFSMFYDRPKRRAIVVVADASFHTHASIVLDRSTFGTDGDTDTWPSLKLGSASPPAP